MSNVVSTGPSMPALSWDGEGRRVSGGALAPDLPAPPGEELTFSDFLSVINPLQHIPVVSSIYRWITGDSIKPAARVIGGALYGGPVGLATAAFNAIVEQVKGADLGAQVIALVMPDRTQPEAAPQMAAAAPEEKTAPMPETGRAEANLAALQQLAADLRSAAQAPAELKLTDSKPAEPQPVAPLQPGQARTLAFYQANAGRRLPTADPNRHALPQQPSGLLMHTTSAIPPSSSGETDRKEGAATGANPGDSPPAA